MKYLFHIILLIILVVSAVVFYLWYDNEDYFWQNVEHYLGSDARNYVEPKVRKIRGSDIKDETQKADELNSKVEPTTRYPIESPEPDPKSQKDNTGSPDLNPLPTMEKSDGSIKTDLKEIINVWQIDKLFNLKNIIGRFVVTVDNLTYKNLPGKYRLFKRLDGNFLVHKDSTGRLSIDENNYHRYDELVNMISDINTHKLITLYKRYYPLIQQTYTNLGYPNKYFNDVLIDAVEHLIKAPVQNGPIELVRPSVYYKYADPSLENLSGGQKILLRIGILNAVKIKTKLKEIRNELTRPNYSLQ